MAGSDAQRELVRFLEQKAFDPVMRADPAKYPESKRGALRDVQRRTEAEIDRFRHYASARDVVVNLKRDLNSDAAQTVHRALHQFGLPTINEVCEEFEQLAADLGVT